MTLEQNTSGLSRDKSPLPSSSACPERGTRDRHSGCHKQEPPNYRAIPHVVAQAPPSNPSLQKSRCFPSSPHHPFRTPSPQPSAPPPRHPLPQSQPTLCRAAELPVAPLKPHRLHPSRSKGHR